MSEEREVPLLFMIAIFITLFLAIFDNTVTNMAGLYIVSELGGSNNISVYALVFFGVGCLLGIPIANFLADRFGMIKLLVYNYLVYVVFSTIITHVPTFFLFLVARIGLGWTAGISYIVCMKMLRVFTTPALKKEVCSFISTLLYSVVPALAVAFGAVFAYEGNWRWIFYLNEPLSLSLAGYFWFFCRHLEPTKPSKHPLDRVGYFSFAISIVGFLVAFTLAQELDWYRSNIFMALLFLSVPAFVLFVLWERIHPHPAVNIRLLKKPDVLYGLLNLGLMFGSYFGMIILLTFWLHLEVNYTALWVGNLTMLMGASGIATAFIIRKWLLQKDPRYTLSIALMFLMISSYYSTYFNQEIDFFHLAVARLLAGVGIVLFLYPLGQMILGRYEDCIDDMTPLFQIVRIFFSNLGAGGFVILWQRRTVFFHSRLTEQVTPTSIFTNEYFQKAQKIFGLTEGESVAQLNVSVNNVATSLALNDCFGFMGYIFLALFILLLLTFAIEKITGKPLIAERKRAAHRL